MSHDKLLTKPLTLPLEVHFYPHHGRYDTKLILRIGAPNWRSGIKHRRWWADPQGDWRAEEEISPWEVRSRFLDDDDAGWDEFTYIFGKFGGVLDLLLDRRRYKGTELSADFGLEADFQEWRALLRRAMHMPMQKWSNLRKHFPKRKVLTLLRPPRFTVRWQNGRPIAVLTANTALDAILASLHLDRLDGVKFRDCARCGKPFRVTSRHVKIYCGHRCAHYVAVKNSRQRKKKLDQRNARPAPSIH